MKTTDEIMNDDNTPAWKRLTIITHAWVKQSKILATKEDTVKSMLRDYRLDRNELGKPAYV
jgi:DNA-directed RNA polymerase subunit H (RpoH/RPB5)